MNILYYIIFKLLSLTGTEIRFDASGDDLADFCQGSKVRKSCSDDSSGLEVQTQAELVPALVEIFAFNLSRQRHGNAWTHIKYSIVISSWMLEQLTARGIDLRGWGS